MKVWNFPAATRSLWHRLGVPLQCLVCWDPRRSPQEKSWNWRKPSRAGVMGPGWLFQGLWNQRKLRQARGWRLPECLFGQKKMGEHISPPMGLSELSQWEANTYWDKINLCLDDPSYDQWETTRAGACLGSSGVCGSEMPLASALKGGSSSQPERGVGAWVSCCLVFHGVGGKSRAYGTSHFLVCPRRMAAVQTAIQQIFALRPSSEQVPWPLWEHLG